MADPYVYEGTNILINKLNIKNEQELINIETQFFIANMLDIPSIIHELDFSSKRSIQQIHQFLFDAIYSWAGEFRTINIYKSEQVLNGLSITYSDQKIIERDLEELFCWSNTIQWTIENEKLVEDFARFMIVMWRIHPFRDGNTRMTSVFMNFFAERNKIEFNGEILSKHPGYLRKALVLAAVEEAPEPEYLLEMLKDVLSLKDVKNIDNQKHCNGKYQMIKQYKTTEYKQKPFETDFE